MTCYNPKLKAESDRLFTSGFEDTRLKHHVGQPPLQGSQRRSIELLLGTIMAFQAQPRSINIIVVAPSSLSILQPLIIS